MAAESVGAVVNSPAVGSDRLGLNQEDFLKVLLSQLQYQDPLDPLDNKEFIAQLAQFSALEQQRQSNDKVDALLTVSSADQAIGLLGKTVEVSTDAGNVVGSVTASAFEEGSPVLTIKKADNSFLTDIRLSQIRIVR